MIEFETLCEPRGGEYIISRKSINIYIKLSEKIITSYAKIYTDALMSSDSRGGEISSMMYLKDFDSKCIVNKHNQS